MRSKITAPELLEGRSAPRTMAEAVAAIIGEDRRRHHEDGLAGDGRTLAQVCAAYGALAEPGINVPPLGGWGSCSVAAAAKFAAREPVRWRYVFNDGSAIVVAGDCWEIEGAEPFSMRPDPCEDHRPKEATVTTTLILEVPHRGEPLAWTDHDGRDIERVAEAKACRSGRVIHESGTVGQIAAASSTTLDEIHRAGGGAEGFEGMLARALDQHGPAATLYRADYAREEGEYSPEPIGYREAALAALAEDLSGFYTAETDAEIRALFARLTGPDAPRVGLCGPVAAAYALARVAKRDFGVDLIPDDPITDDEEG